MTETRQQLNMESKKKVAVGWMNVVASSDRQQVSFITGS